MVQLVCYCCRNSINISTTCRSTTTSRKSAGQNSALQDCWTLWNIQSFCVRIQSSFVHCFQWTTSWRQWEYWHSNSNCVSGNFVAFASNKPLKAFCFWAVHVSMCHQMLKVCKHDILMTACGSFNKFTTWMQLQTEMNWLHFECKYKRSKVNVAGRPNMVKR